LAQNQITFDNLREEYVDTINICREFVFLDARASTSDMIMRLRTIIDEQRFHLMPFIQMVVPKVCEAISTHVELTRTKHPDVKWLPWSIFYKEIQVIPSVSHESEDTIRAAASFLHNVGLIYFDNNGDANRVVILDCKWFFEGLLGWLLAPMPLLEAHRNSAWLKFSKTARDGPVPREFIPRLSPQDPVPPSDAVPDSLFVLECLDLCVRAPNNPRQYLFPLLIQTSEPRDAWMPDSKYKFYQGLKIGCATHMTVLPSGLLAKVIVRLCRQFPNFVLWKDAAKFITVNETEAMLFLSVDRASIYIVSRDRSQQQSARSLLLDIYKTVRSAAQLSSGLNLNVEYSSARHLYVDIREPATYPRHAILDCHTTKSSTISHPDPKMNIQDSIVEILGGEPDGMPARYLDIISQYPQN
jgi:hypothetical protein